ncbi:NADH-quinone oxidoreductase subunit L [Parvularcula dongshanensis]|uniref:NADH-quinone oxidoreductase subunit L n=1 Tax=Parvularcula dongshanensis TaxID=1173995 RepID=A0A840I674_9PROT|nr:NADH-quinone oxidoreductase subunit L [Parvularcula dongshanensis]MBB4659771.1 NADH-quinone oxidoreductase subunit L [Parvularcula dongshanensis]
MEVLIVLLPLLGAILAMPLGHTGGARAAEVVTSVLVGIACFLAWITFFGFWLGDAQPHVLRLFTWIAVGDLVADWAVRVDTLSAVMLIVVTTVSTLVHVYSIGYMHEDPSRPRFFAYLSLFTFAMLMLVTADNLIQLFFGWEGVGLASYLLIGFYHFKDSANDASIKAFVMNRVGDVGLALGIMACFFVFRSVEFDVILDAVRNNAAVQPFGAEAAVPLDQLQIGFLDRTPPALEIIGILLFIGAMGKSAQFLLHTWLPDAMEGPTPVSALIHAATMVTAGVFLVCRMSDLYAAAPGASAFVTFIGATTAIFAASVALVQQDIKRVIAYSTASQLGYMFFAAGVGAYGASMFHLTTHAFFKALLFLGAGAVIHFSHHEQDMRRMGGLREQMPATFALMLIGTLAITGVGIPLVTLFGAPFGFAGFVSKDMMIEGAYEGIGEGAGFATYAFVIGLLVAALTSFYSWRLVFLTFSGKWRAPESVRKHPHHVPGVMMFSMVPLALGAVVAGIMFYSSFVGDGAGRFWAASLNTGDTYESIASTADTGGEEPVGVDTEQTEGAAEPTGVGGHATDTAHADESHGAEAHGEEAGGHHEFPTWVLVSPFVAMLAGLLAALFQYRGGDPFRPGLIGQGGLLYGFLSNRWYIDGLYRRLFLEPARILGRFLWKKGDEATIDALGPDGLSRITSGGARAVVRGQTGYVFHYAFVMLIGVTVLLLMILL